jgi:hypothetical protein
MENNGKPRHPYKKAEPTGKSLRALTKISDFAM